MIKFPRIFFAQRDSGNTGAMATLQRHARRVLRRVAQDLRLAGHAHEIVVDPGRRGSRGRVSLRTETLFVDLVEKQCGAGVAFSFRTRRGCSDLSGGGENYVPIEQVESLRGYQSFLEGLRLAGGINTGSGARR